MDRKRGVNVFTARCPRLVACYSWQNGLASERDFEPVDALRTTPSGTSSNTFLIHWEADVDGEIVMLMIAK